ncbi:7-cyano-7-deazaguanine reductase [Bradyrhizobium sp. AZCC 1610]
MMAKKSLQKSLQLGRAVEWPDSPEKAQLDRVPNPQADTNYLVRFTAPEFTSICPVTGQPDFAHLMIDYVPGQWLLESKSLKLYVASFRNHGAFHEDCTVMIGKRIAAEIKPKWLRIGGYWYPRGAASRSTCSGRPANSPTACGYPTRASRPIAAGVRHAKRSGMA